MVFHYGVFSTFFIMFLIFHILMTNSGKNMFMYVFPSYLIFEEVSL